MVPGEIIAKSTEVEINSHHPETATEVESTGDRPIQVDSHPHFYEADAALDFGREMAYGRHLDIPTEAAVQLEPGDKKEVQLVEYTGERKIFDFHGMVSGPVDESHIYRPADEDDEYADIFGDNGTENVNEKEEKRS